MALALPTLSTIPKYFGTVYGVPLNDDDPLLTIAEMARRAGVTPGTLYSYRRKGMLPEPDDLYWPDRPRWRTSTFDKWMKSRPKVALERTQETGDPLLTITELARATGVQRHALYGARTDGRFPPPDDASVQGHPRWRLSTVERWLEGRRVRRKQAPGQTGVGHQDNDQSGPRRRP